MRTGYLFKRFILGFLVFMILACPLAVPFVSISKAQQLPIISLESRHESGASSNLGTITFDSTTHNLPTSFGPTYGDHPITYNPLLGYSFLRWEIVATGTPSSMVIDPNAQTTSIHLDSSTTLRAVYTGSGPITPSLGFEFNGMPVTSIDVAVSSKFNVEIWIRNIPKGYGLKRYSIIVTWDPSQVELFGSAAFAPVGASGWNTMTAPLSSNQVKFVGTGGEPSPADTRAVLLILHCLAESPPDAPPAVTAESPFEDSIDLVTLPGGQAAPPLAAGPVQLRCNQRVPRPVGGVVTPVNKVAVLSPYFALIGLFAVVTAAVAIRKRKA